MCASSIPRKNFYTIGEVSKYTATTRRTIRYYEDIDVLEPDMIGDNGYRYYKYNTMLRIPIIKYYQFMGFSLDEIRNQFKTHKYTDILQIFNSSLEKYEQELKDLKDRELITYAWKKLIEEACAIIATDFTDINIKFCDSAKLLYNEYNFNGNYHEATINLEFTNFVRERGTNIYGPVMIMFPSLEERLSGKNIIKSKVIQKCTDKVDEKYIFERPRGLYLCKYHIGSHSTLENSYNEIIKYVEKKNIEFEDFVIERYVTDHWTLNWDDQYVTEIQIPIKQGK